MKYLISIVLAATLSLPTFGQQVKYKIVQDNPDINNWLSINIDFLGMEVSLPHTNAIDAASFNIGLWGHVDPGLPVGFQYSFQRSWFVFGGFGQESFPQNTDIQLGTYWMFADNTKKKVIQVGLKTEVDDNYRTNTRTTTTTTIKVPGTVRNEFGLRGGFMYKNAPHVLDTDEDPQPPVELASHLSMGLYAGIMNRNTSNLVIDTDKYGRVNTASKARNIFLDVIIAPINSFDDVNNNNANVTKEVKDFVSTFPLGARLGLQVYQVEKKAFTGKKFGLSARSEIGYRPYIGPYVNASFGLTLVKLQK
jgi:hypothetical protein